MWRIALPGTTEPNAIPLWEQVDCSGDSPPTCWLVLIASLVKINLIFVKLALHVSSNFPVAVARESMYVFSGQTGIVNTNSLYRFNFGSSKWSRISTEHILQDSPNPPIRR